ncbi:SDR family NAD(P)-dependent oxidoreductase [Dactylosporangium sp. CA-152071]|uniref:SDR family NAD(P)-dependent oxidoreductase n=1 Tax=Dactylosporangium sp. CA-152071 TaxID=3239933 RepID=UPI003D8F2B77
MRWTEAEIGDQGGKTFLVTGANSGLGYETTRALLAKGARVIMAVRSEAKGRAAVQKLGGGELRIVDLADLDSVRALAAGLRRDREQTSGPTGVMKAFMRVGNAVLAQPAARGALNQLYAAVDPRAEGGQFIGPDGMGENRGWPSVVEPVARAKDPADAQRLWTLSEQLTGVQFEGARSR